MKKSALLLCLALFGCADVRHNPYDDIVDITECVPGLVHPDYNEKKGYKEIFVARTITTKIIILENDDTQRIVVLKQYFVKPKSCVLYDSYPTIVFGPKM